MIGVVTDIDNDAIRVHAGSAARENQERQEY
jgi:hypothetical protein